MESIAMPEAGMGVVELYILFSLISALVDHPVGCHRPG